MKLWNRLRYMKLINICHLLCFNCKMQGKMLTLRVFTALAYQTVAVLLIPVFSPLWISWFILKCNCIVRESNPGRPRGRRAFYHWTNDAWLLTIVVFLMGTYQNSSCGRVVKATDSKSVSLWERRFESYQLRHRLFWVLSVCHRSQFFCCCSYPPATDSSIV